MNKRKTVLSEKVSTINVDHSSEEAFLNRFMEIAIDAIDNWYQSLAREEKDG